MRIHANMLIRLDYKYSCKIFTLFFMFDIYTHVHVSLQVIPVFVWSLVHLLPMKVDYEANTLFVRNFCQNDGLIF